MKEIYTAEIKRDLDEAQKVLDRFLSIHAFRIDTESLNDSKQNPTNVSDREGSTSLSRSDSRGSHSAPSEGDVATDSSRNEFLPTQKSHQALALSKFITAMRQKMSKVFSFFRK